MSDVATVEDPKVVLSEQEWAALPDDLKAAFEQDGDSYVADEAAVAELTKRAAPDADDNVGDSHDADQDDDEAGNADEQLESADADPAEMPAGDDDLPEFTVELADADYDRLPVDMRVLYERKGGKWIAIPELRVELEKAEAKFLAEIAEMDATIAAKTASIESMERQLREITIGNAVTDVLVAAGCRPGLMKAAIALFVSDHAIHTTRQADGSYDIEVEGSDGMIDISTAVQLWLLTEDGRVMQKDPPSKRSVH